MLASIGAVATIIVPLATPDSLLGILAVSVMNRPERMQPTPDLLDRLSGVAAHASTALQNGRLVDQITHQALHDDLTGLANRLQLTTALRSAVNHARPRGDTVTLAYLDLDGFKPVNDQLGHHAGDEPLIAVSQRLTATTRADDLVARLGGDEFAILIAGHTIDATRLQARLAAAFSDPFTIAGVQLNLHVSVGCAVFPADADTSDSLLAHADAAMFTVKRNHHATMPHLPTPRPATAWRRLADIPTTH